MASSSAVGLETEVLRRRWPEVLDTLNHLKKATWALVSQNAQVGELTASTLTLAFAVPGLANAFRSGVHAEMVQRAVHETLGFDVRVEGSLVESGSGGTTPTGGTPAGGTSAGRGTTRGRPSGSAVVDRARAEASWSDVEPPHDEPEPPSDGSAEPTGGSASSATSAREAGAQAHAAAVRRAADAPAPVPDSPQPDDPDIATSNLIGAPLVEQMLGGTVIEDQIGDET